MMDLVAFEAGAKKNCPIYEFLGLSVLEAENGVFKATIPNSKEAGNHIGIMHAGVLFSLGEFLGGLITARYLDNPRKFQPVVRDLKIDFKAPAMTDITATAYFSAEQGVEMNAKLEETGRYDFQQKAVLTDTNGTVVAETLGSYALRNFMG
mgnify:CR=1 FL=1|jgi:uncharacterized protein (TIGR00369 family)